MKILIAGLGSIGRRHFRNLKSLGENDLILYRTHRSTLSDDELAGVPVETDLNVALAQKPDAVIVSNPTALHLDVAIPAVAAGCAVLLEKPISHHLERVDELLAAQRASGAPVLVAFQFRYHPGIRQVRTWLQDGAIGRPLSARAHWGEFLANWHPWEDYRQSYSARADLGGGVVLTLSHPLDYLRWLLGDVQDLFAFTGKLGDLEMGVEDTAEIVLRFAGGCLGSLHLDYNQQPAAHTLEIIGTQGTLTWDNATGAARCYRAQTNVWEQVDLPQGFERNHLFLDEMRHFLAVARREEQPICLLEDGVRALDMAMAALRSGQSGERVPLSQPLPFRGEEK
ncbi:MAG: Gfo/Idh/MocA family oxidoreductase [Anaerolineaceae bacterium]